MNKHSPWLSSLSLALLAGCSSAPTRLYTLQPMMSASAPVAYQGPPLRVAAVNFPADLDRPEIVMARGEGELRISDQDHWAAPLSKMAQQILSADLVSRLPAGKVAFPRLPAGAAVPELRVDILRTAGRQGASMVANWQLAIDPHTNRSGVVDLPGQPLSGPAGEVAQTLSSLLSHLADQIAAELSQPTAAN